jgi:hypothetical protein
MALSQAEREADSVDVAQNHSGPVHKFKVAKNPGLTQKFQRITVEQVEKAFNHFAQHGQMSRQEFERCMMYLVLLPSVARCCTVFPTDWDSSAICTPGPR